MNYSYFYYHSLLQTFMKEIYFALINNFIFTLQRNDFSLFDPEWTACEELKLLNAIADHGIGNW